MWFINSALPQPLFQIQDVLKKFAFISSQLLGIITRWHPLVQKRRLESALVFAVDASMKRTGFGRLQIITKRMNRSM